MPEAYAVWMGELIRHLDVRHFSSFELCRAGTVNQGVRLRPPPAELARNIIPTLVRLETIRRAVGRIRVTSGYRDPEYNRAVGGTPGSLHTRFNAVDLVPLDCTTQQLTNAILALPRARDWFGVIHYRSRGFVHFDTRVLAGLGARPHIDPG